jgi:uncharacterized cupin superfamily protein
MTSESIANALTARLDHRPVAAEQVVDGAPTTGEAELGALGGTETGVWEMTAGAMSDTEVAELSVVIAGGATVEFTDPDGAVTHSRELVAGDVIRFSGGERTVWRVADRIRKIYVVES